ncbi:MAG: TetR/AcrR family transcriptional regulator [Agarilytica sp.]
MAPPRDPESTRQHILEVTAEEMRQNGFKAASLADILAKAEVSKGALYHHFANKQELGYAVFDEVFVREFLADWDLPMSSDEPIDALCKWMTEFAEHVSEEVLQQGCPVYNIATEMSSADEGFRSKTTKMFETLQAHLAETIETAKRNGQVKTDIDPESVAPFIVATIQGSMMQGKYGRNLETFKASIKCLASYLASLKA